MENALNYLKSLLKKNDTVVLACSGGPDSMYLFNMLLNLKKEFNIKIVCAHVNHNVREESASEALFVEDYCKKNDAIFEYLEIKEHPSSNFHNATRTIRYNFFYELLKKYKAPYLLTAHHGDDLMETVLMRITRGSTLIGYSGFQKKVLKKNFSIIRPLVYLTKEEIKEYDDKHNIPYVLDKSNDKDKYTRNRYRHTILPFLKNEDPSIHLKYLKFSEKLEECHNYISKKTNEEYKNVYNNSELNLDLFVLIEDFIKKCIIEKILKDLFDGDLSSITDRHVQGILDLISCDKKNTQINLPGNLLVKKRYNKLIFTKEEITSSEFNILFDGKYEDDNHIICIDDKKDNSNNCIKLDSSDIVLPIIIRNRHEHDKMEIKNLNGHKKIKDIFIDEKINFDLRDSYPIVTDSRNEILWIPGIKKSKYDKDLSEKCDIILKYTKKGEN